MYISNRAQRLFLLKIAFLNGLYVWNEPCSAISTSDINIPVKHKLGINSFNLFSLPNKDIFPLHPLHESNVSKLPPVPFRQHFTNVKVIVKIYCNSRLDVQTIGIGGGYVSAQALSPHHLPFHFLSLHFLPPHFLPSLSVPLQPLPRPHL